MPGLSALQKLNSDLLNLGDEVKIRSARGEKPVTVPIPQSIEDIDDSNDFKFGMPTLSEEEQAQADAAEAERQRAANDFSDITGEDDEEEESAPKPQEQAVPDLSDLLSTNDLDLSDLDLSEFEEEEEEEEEPPAPVEIPIEDMDLEALLAPKAEPEPPKPAPAPKKKTAAKPAPQSKPVYEEVNLDDIDASIFEEKKSQPSPSDVPDIPELEEELSSPSDIPDIPELEEELSPEVSDIPELTEDIPLEEEIPAAEDLSFEETASATEEVFDIPEMEEAAPENISEITPEITPEEEFSTEGLDTPDFNDGADTSFDNDFDSLGKDFEDSADSIIDLNADVPAEFNEVPDNPEIDNVYERQSSLDKISPEDISPVEDKDLTTEEVSLDDFDDPSFSADTGADSITEPGSEPAADSGADSGEFDLDDVIGAFENENAAAFDENFPTDAMETPEVTESGEAEIPSDTDLFSTDGLDEPESEASPEDVFSTAGLDDSESADESNPFSTDGLDDNSGSDSFADMPDMGDMNFGEGTENPAASEEIPSDDFGNDFSTDGLDSDSENGDAPEMNFGDTSGLDEDLPDFGDDGSANGDVFGGDFGTDVNSLFDTAESGSEPSPDEEVSDDIDSTEETFDTSDISGLDFSGTDNSDSDFQLGTITETESDDEFFIPGFSDTVTADLNKKPAVQAPDFSQAVAGGDKSKPKNTFTDAEYERFNKNLNTYPLNVKIALEDLIVKNELTDDALFEILEKVLRKVPARQLASDLEKVTDLNIDVPRDFERRSVEEYEAYKKSIEYQLKNKIIPGALVTTIAAILVFCIFTLVKTFIYQPAMAEHLYKQGYALLEENMYPQSEDKFNKALTYKSKEPWFFKYAEGYRNHKQYDRARMMYKAILQRYKHDKNAGLLWAEMEAKDLYNYEEAERLLKREVLDYHINDSQAILQLGDLYLDWATELDPSKYPLAKEQYDSLFSLYGSTNEYLAREMRYFIRTDNLRQVLMYKDIFFPRKKALGSEDLTELSGFLLDKRYGKLRASEENLRFSIENVRELLERAIKADDKNPVAQYNMARYFVETNNTRGAAYYLKNAISLFEQQNVRNKRDTYKFINAYRLLGEQYIEQKEYLLSEENFGKGIDLFEKEHESSGFECNEQIGKLYADLADLDYFIAGDNDTALTNYVNAVNNKYDTSSVRYRIGYIQYQKENYPAALGSFIRSHDTNSNDMNLLLALANTLSLNNDSYVAKGYYEHLLENLEAERERNKILFSRVTDGQIEVIDMYMRASNNLGVTLSRLANQTGNSGMNAQAIVQLQESLRAWDALTRNPVSMVRLDGSNLAEQNIKYIINPKAEYQPEIYTEIKRTLYGEKGIE